MVGGVKAYYAVLLALVLIVGGAKVLSGQGVIEEKKHGDDHHPDHGHSHSDHDHHQAPPLLEMLPPIGPVGSVVAIGVMVQYSLKRKFNRLFEAPPATSIQIDHDRHHHDHDGHDHDHDGHDHVSEGHGDSNETAP